MSLRVTTTEMHTGGEPVRLIESGYPPIPGDTILDKRRHVATHLDHLRRFLMLEPRGHDDMYGVLMVEPDLPEADLAVLFMHNDGYSTMCGHAVIAVGAYAVERGLVAVEEPVTHLVVQVPCGRIDVWVDVTDGRPGASRFHSVGAFAPALDQRVEVAGYGDVPFDLAYGGAFYAVAPASRLGLDVRSSPVRHLVDAATALSHAVRDHPALVHPDSPDLGFLYGSILTDDAAGNDPSTNICVFADGQVDRSPTGSGVTARLAVAHARGETVVGQRRHFESVIGTTMTGAVVAATTVGEHPAVVVEVEGTAHITGSATFTLDPADPLREGFRVR